MTEKQRDYLKALIAEEREHGMFDVSNGVIRDLGGKDWESKYESVSNAVVSNAIKVLNFSIHQSSWAIEHGYE